MSERPIVFLDTETDGLRNDRQVWEIGMVRRDPDGGEDRAYSKFVEINLEDAEPMGLSVGRFYERHPVGKWLAGGPTFGVNSQLPPEPNMSMVSRYQAAHDVARWTHGAIIVGIVPHFDLEVLGELLRDQGLTPSWYYQPIDAEVLAAGYAKIKEQTNMAGLLKIAPETVFQPSKIDPPYDSEAISRLVGVEPPSDEDRHTALGDAHWARRLYEAVMY